MWAAEVIGRTETGHVVKVQVTFDEEPDYDREAKMRAEAQAVMRREHSAWCNAISYRKFELPSSDAAGSA